MASRARTAAFGVGILEAIVECQACILALLKPQVVEGGFQVLFFHMSVSATKAQLSFHILALHLLSRIFCLCTVCRTFAIWSSISCSRLSKTVCCALSAWKAFAFGSRGLRTLLPILCCICRCKVLGSTLFFWTASRSDLCFSV